MSRGQLAVLVGLLTLPNFGADGATWRQYGFDNTHFSRQPDETDLNASSVATLHVDWDFSIPSDGRRDQFSASPSVDDNTVYIGGLNGIFYAIFATGDRKGKCRWQYPPATTPALDGCPATTPPPDACGTTTAPLLVSTLPTTMGNRSGPGIASSAAIVDNVAGHKAVIFGAPDPNSNGGDGRLWALDAATGQCIWKSTVLAPTNGTSKIGYSSPAIAHGRAYIGVSAKIADLPATIGQLFAIDLNTGSRDPAFNFTAMGPPAGGGIWSSPAVTPDGNIVVTTGNSCHESHPNCSMAIPQRDYSISMIKLDFTNGNVLQQLQPVNVNFDFDADWAASPIVGQVSCGTLAMSVQKDGYLHALEIMTGVSFAFPCSYQGHSSLECPRWTFPTVPSSPFAPGVPLLPFEDDGHGEAQDQDGNLLIHPGALDGDHLFIATGGLDLAEAPRLETPHDPKVLTNRLYSLDVCASDLDRVRWTLDLDGAVGSPSFANGVIYVGTTETRNSVEKGNFYAIADINVLPSLLEMCEYPNIKDMNVCRLGSFRTKPVPRIVAQLGPPDNMRPRNLTIVGNMPGIPAIANGQVFVATTAGHLYGLVR